MVTSELKSYALSHFQKNYKKLLAEHIYQDKDMVKALFSNKNIEKCFYRLAETYFNVLVKFYEQNPNGTYLEELEYIKNSEAIKNALSEYYSFTNDTQVFKFLKVYSYMLQEFAVEQKIYDEDGYLKTDGLKTYFSSVLDASIGMYPKVLKDMEQNNYWWLKDNATTLRRQFSEDFIVLSRKRCQALCDKYFERKVNLTKEFSNATNGGEKLIEELDAIIYKRFGALPFYCWWETTESGEKVLRREPEPPKDGTYSFNAYQQNFNTEKVDNQK